MSLKNTCTCHQARKGETSGSASKNQWTYAKECFGVIQDDDVIYFCDTGSPTSINLRLLKKHKVKTLKRNTPQSMAM